MMISKAPAPPPPLDGLGLSKAGSEANDWPGPTANIDLQNLSDAVWSCTVLIKSARNLRRFPGAQWAVEAKRWPILRAAVDRALNKCRASRVPEVALTKPLFRIELLDDEWSGPAP
jgi:hypothetical protein